MVPFGAIPTTKIPVIPGFLGPLSDSNRRPPLSCQRATLGCQWALLTLFYMAL